MDHLVDKRILVTGASGKVGIPLIKRLAHDNEVWGICRFSKPGRREMCEAAGAATRSVDLIDPDFSALPDKFDHIIHLGGEVCQGDENGVFMPHGDDFFKANEINGIGTGKIMSRFRSAASCLVVSTLGVYEQRSAEEAEVLVNETGMLGSFHENGTTYSASKQAQEVIARFCADDFGLPTIIARLGAQLSSIEDGLAAGWVNAILAGMPFPAIYPDRNSIWQFIHDDDIYGQIPYLLQAASTKPVTLNWTGSELVDMKEVARFIAKRLGVASPEFVEDPWGLFPTLADTSKLVQLAGPCKVDWKEAFDRVMDDLFPDTQRV